MKLKRTLQVKYPKTYNELAESVNSKEVVIFITGKLYDEMKDKATTSKWSKRCGTMGKILMIGGIVVGAGIPTLLVGAANTVLGKAADEFKKYDVKINKNAERIELYLKKGPEKYDKNYDELSY